MQTFRFLDWKMYKDGQDLFTDVLGMVKKIPREYRFELGSQIIRSALSITLNIAEGSGKASNKELAHYLNIALGSLYETVANVDTLKINQIIDQKECLKMHAKALGIAKQLGGFRKKLGST